MNGVASYKSSSHKLENAEVFFVKHMTPKVIIFIPRDGNSLCWEFSNQ